METPKAANENNHSKFEDTNIEALEKYDTFVSALNNADSIDAIRGALVEYAVETITEKPELPNKDHWPRQKVLISFTEENEYGAREWNDEQSLEEVLLVLESLEKMMGTEQPMNYIESINTIKRIKLVPVQGRLYDLLYPKKEVED
jgi:hypothetical protein